LNTLAGKRADVGVVIAAGGSGRRFGGSLPKQFLKLGRVPVLQRTIAAFHGLPEVGEIVVVAPPAYIRRVEALVRRAGFGRVCRVTSGGRERQDSVWNGLHAFSRPPAIVLVHDAVRPMVSRRVIRDVIAAARRHGAAVVGVRVTDTIKRESPAGFYAETLDRKALWAVQTPQGFRYRLLRRAHERARDDRYAGTDESSLVERMGKPVRIVPGEERNRKITTADDLRIAGMFVK
jgi:2-C-methyl-D-erythritol 4-phosphate cytidylyltransferase